MSSRRRNRLPLRWLLVAVFLTVLCSAASAQQGPVDGNTRETTASTGGESFLAWVIHTSGWIGGVLLLMSFVMVARIVECFLELRQGVVMPPDLLADWDKRFKNRDIQGVYASARESGSVAGQLLASGLHAASAGLSEARESIDRGMESVVVNMEKRISILAVIGSLGPLIGLLGTLKGMISSFSVIARSETQMKASEVAGGISEALLITFEGVALSVPAIFFYAHFKNQIAVLTLDASAYAEDCVRQVIGARRMPSAQASPAKNEA